nr:PREDICTED: leucine zipper protein 1 isoform X2 [Latimeria chalumnae]|eukprot:XP_014351800.1 PREDICTED: leucine zipper protein 1 isoform X2 [Latimeria chalumnae]
MSDLSGYKETSTRHLRHKLQSLGRRLDDLEEAAKNLQRAEDELLDLQDKIIQVEGSNSGMLTEVDTLRKRVLKIEGKDEEVRKAEDLCRSVKEKLENEEKLTKDLKLEIKKLQKRMAELEKLEEAFNKSKSDCTQLCLSLNEEKNLTKKLTSELEILRAKVKELEASEGRLDKVEQTLISEMERLKSLTVGFISERKLFLDKQMQDEKLIQELTQKLEQNNKNTEDQSRNVSNLRERSLSNLSERGDLRIDDELSLGMPAKVGLRKSLDYLKRTENEEVRNKVENEKTEDEEDNKVKDLTQEVERLKNRLKQLELVEEELNVSKVKNSELLEKFQSEQTKAKTLADKIEEMKAKTENQKGMENGELESEEVSTRGKALRQEKPKFRSTTAETQRYKSRELSPQQHRRERPRNRDLFLNDENSPKSSRRALSPSLSNKKPLKVSSTTAFIEGKRIEEKPSVSLQKDMGGSQNEVKRLREPPSVLSRYPPAANEQTPQKPWKSSPRINENGPNAKSERMARTFGDLNQNITEALSEKSRRVANPTLTPEKETKADQNEPTDVAPVKFSTETLNSLSNGSVPAYRAHIITSPPVSEPRSSPSSETGVPVVSDCQSPGAKPLEKVPTQDESESPLENPDFIARSSVSQYTRSRRREPLLETSRSLSERDLVKTLNAAFKAAEDSGAETKRPCSPREALTSKAVIKPAIIERDKKEVMSGAMSEPSPERQRPSSRAVPNKVTSSITIYPSEPGSQRTYTSDTPRERHTSTSNIIITPSEAAKSNNSVPYEFSISKSDISLMPFDSEKVEDSVSVCKTETLLTRSSITVKPLEPAEKNNNETSESCDWRTYQTLRDDSAEFKNITVRSRWRSRSGLTAPDESEMKHDDADHPATPLRFRTSHSALPDSEDKEAKANETELFTGSISAISSPLSSVQTFRRSRTSYMSETGPRRNHNTLATSQFSWKRQLGPTLQ